jgi:predicted 2-oxoglutarate/Fe(II)-dependent dioxygenase YbiX
MLPAPNTESRFPPGRNEPCFCGSGERFKRCCGNQSPGRPPPHGISIEHDFLSPQQCRAFVDLADRLEGDRFKVLDRARNLEPTLDDTRVCERVTLDQSQYVFDDLVARAFEERIIPRTGAIDWYEQPQLLRYGPGGYYVYHSDAYDYEEGSWRKAADRDISLLLYVNDEYTGGELEFPSFSYTLRPRAGMLVWFPSDFRYLHMAKVVTSGRRYTIVSWAAASGVERVRPERPNRSIWWTTREKKVNTS